ncbi:MAG: hypothetical protein AB8B65_03570 [Kordia sp.]|uniref:hypothetical protein n=1 Tax=Kordia sp. TaxID=1965332 RepID=UPI00385BAC08
MKIFYHLKKCFLVVNLLLTYTLFATSINVDPCDIDNDNDVLLNLLVGSNIVYDGTPLAVNTAQISDFGTNNFSNNHYEYLVTLSDGVYAVGNQYIGGTYSISIELLSLGNSFTYGNFQSCFFVMEQQLFHM